MLTIVLESEKFNTQVSENGQYVVIFTVALIGIFEFLALVFSSCKLGSLYDRKNQAEPQKTSQILEKLGAVQLKRMHITEMVEYLNKSKIKDSEDANLG